MYIERGLVCHYFYITLSHLHLLKLPWQASTIHRILSTFVQSFVIKSAVTITVVVFFSISLKNGDIANEPTNWNWYWYSAFYPLMAVLCIAQVYACYILYSLAQLCSKLGKWVKEGTDASVTMSVVEHNKAHTANDPKAVAAQQTNGSMNMLDGYENSL